MLCFAAYLRRTRDGKRHAASTHHDRIPIRSVTIDQYISHVASLLIEQCHITASTLIRYTLLTQLLDGYANWDDADLPLRLRVKIPLTAALCVVALRVIDDLFRHQPSRRLGLRASLCLGYGLSLRPGEYLTNPHKPVPLKQQANSSSCFFFFGDTAFNVCCPNLYPSGQCPDHFAVFFHHLKNDRVGQGGPRAVARNPTFSPAATDFCCLSEIYTFLLAYPPSSGLPVMSGGGGPVLWTDLRTVLHLTALRSGLDPERVLPHSNRSGPNMQLEDFEDSVKMAQGNWTTLPGMRSYVHGSLKHASKVTSALHDIQMCPVAHLRTFFMPICDSPSSAPDTPIL